GLERLLEDEIRRERHESRDSLLVAQRDEHRHGAALAEPREHDPPRLDAALALARDQRLDALRAPADPRLVVPRAAQVAVRDVVPGGHHPAEAEAPGDRRR